MEFFHEWKADHVARCDKGNLSDEQRRPLFLPWQTEQNLDLLWQGWTQGVKAFMARFPGYIFVPKRMTQSPLESVFSCVRQGSGGTRNPPLNGYRNGVAVKTIANEQKYSGNKAKTNYHESGTDEYSVCYLPEPERLKRRDTRQSQPRSPPLPLVPTRLVLASAASEHLVTKVRTGCALLKALWKVVGPAERPHIALIMHYLR